VIKLAETRDKDGNIIPDKLDQFIAEHKGETGDRAELERIIRSMAGTSKEAPEASSPDGSDD
jgi:hypothetical protein